MKIFKVQIENYRLLKSFFMDMEDELSLVIGKNNTGKTSILSVFDKFLAQSDRNKFSFNDFNLEFKRDIKTIIEAPGMINEVNYKPKGIKLKLFIKYTETDNLSNISRVMMDLNPDNNVIVLSFEYILEFKKYELLKKDFTAFLNIENAKTAEQPDYTPRNLYSFLQSDLHIYFDLHKKSFAYDLTTKTIIEEKCIDLIREEISIKDIINFKYIDAKRGVTNKDANKTLSGQTSRIYKAADTNEEQSAAIQKFKDRLNATDTNLSDIYKTLFDSVIKKVKDFGGIKINESQIEVVSTLQHRELLEGNTTVVYKHDNDNQLPEHYNGLGYMNLISMIFEIEILINEFKREKDKKPADINLLFIEEPEAHTHPQMQYILLRILKNS